MRATLSFFIVDGIFRPLYGISIGWKNDDGSSSEHQQLAYWKNKTGNYNLPADSPWRMDLPSIMSIINYQNDTTKINAPVINNAFAIYGDEINFRDKQYYTP